MLVLVGAVLAGMMSADMGGPLNKTAYAIGVLLLADCLPETGPGTLIMAAIMAGGMVPPLAAGVSSILVPQVYSDKERKNSFIALGKGLVFITEGVIPYLAYNPEKMKFACIVSSAVAGGISMYFRCANYAPHGGIFVIPLSEHFSSYLIALAAGIITGAFLFAIIRLSPAKKVA